MNSQQNNKLSIYEATRAGFKGTLDHFFLFFKALLAFLGSCLLLCSVGGMLSIALTVILVKIFPSLTSNIPGISVPFPEAGVVLGLLYALMMIPITIAILSMYAGLLKLTMDVFDTGAGRVGTLFEHKRMGFRFLLLHFLICSVIGFGFLLLIIPGIYWMTRFWLAPYAMVDKNLGIIESMRTSWRLTDNNKWHFLGLIIVAGAISAVGQATMVGLLITIPMTMLMMVYAYRWQQATVVQQ